MGYESMDVRSLVGKTIAEKYTVLSVLGTGGMGTVVKASQTGLDRLVAIKFLHQSFLTDPESVARFDREALALSRLSHIHIGQFYQCGRWKPELLSASEFPFLVMEYLEGKSLQSL